MTVEPGFGGYKFISHVVPKVKQDRDLYQQLQIEVDGIIAPSTVQCVTDAGVNVLFSGSTVLGADDPRAAIECLYPPGKAA